jgi:hypothetical protein
MLHINIGSLNWRVYLRWDLLHLLNGCKRPIIGVLNFFFISPHDQNNFRLVIKFTLCFVMGKPHEKWTFLNVGDIGLSLCPRPLILGMPLSGGFTLHIMNYVVIKTNIIGFPYLVLNWIWSHILIGSFDV